MKTAGLKICYLNQLNGAIELTRTKMWPEEALAGF